MRSPLDDRTHTLYRFFDQDGALLYIGITLNPAARFAQHQADKPWWLDIRTTTHEHYPSRATVLEAERAAILAEKPRYNIVHNRGDAPHAPRESPQLDRLLPLQPGDWVALGLTDGRCPVGEIVAYDDTWVSLRLKNFWEGILTNTVEVVRWAQVERIQAAYPEDARPPDEAERFLGAPVDARVMDDSHLGHFQTGWEKLHNLDGDPVHRARIAYEQAQRATGRSGA